MINLTISEFAKKYYSMGWNVIPLFNNQKAPSSAFQIEGYNGKWEKYQTERVTEADFNKFFVDNKPTGLGVVTGLVSGIVVIDEDFYLPGGKTLGIQSPLISKTTSGGRHVFLKTRTKINSFVIKDSHIEVQAEKRFIVLPPSICWNKSTPPALGKYEWDVARKEKIPYITAEELEKYKPQSANASVLLRDLMESGNGSRHNDLRTIALKMFNRFSQSEWDIAESFIREAAKKTIPPYITPQEINDMNTIIKNTKNLVLKNPKSIYIEEKKVENLPKPVSMSVAYIERLEERKKEAIAPKTGYGELDESISGWTPGFVYILAGDPGVGKCHGKDTEILMFNGTIKKVQNIKVGDLLMGPDNKSRKVLSINSGFGNLYNVKQKFGKDYVVNEDHILSLKWSPLKIKRWKEYKVGKTFNIPLKEYLSKSNLYKKFAKGYKSKIKFNNKKILIDPYFLGVWLGDGTSKKVSVTSMDKEIIDELKYQANKYNLKVRIYNQKNNKSSTYALNRGKTNALINDNGINYTPLQYSIKKGCKEEHISYLHRIGKIKYNKQENVLFKYFKKYNLFGNKHIPLVYKTNSIQKRLELLAGIIDTDGWLGKDLNRKTHRIRKTNRYTISVVNKKLANDIFYLSSSLGFNVSFHEKISHIKKINYSVKTYTVSISGNVGIIPIRIPRKKVHKIRYHAFGETKIEVNGIGKGEYFGFTLTGDGLYLLSDFTVTHNTAFACNISHRCLKQNKKVLYYAIETGNEVLDYMASVRLEKRYEDLTNDELSYNDPNFLIYRNEVISLSDLKATLKEQKNNFDLAIIDNIGFFEEKSSSPTQAQLELMRDISKLALESQVAIILIAHFNKPPPGGKNIVTMDRISGSKAFQNYAKGVLLMKRNKKSDLPDEMEYLDDGLLIVAKSKRGANKVFRLMFSNASAVIKTNMDYSPGSLERQGF